jgi:hypothetical protein
MLPYTIDGGKPGRGSIQAGGPPHRVHRVVAGDRSPRTWSHLSLLADTLHFNLFLRQADTVKRGHFTMFSRLRSRNQEGETYPSLFFYMFQLFCTNVRTV